MTITLESIEEQQSRIAEMISEFKRDRSEKTVVLVPEFSIELAHGERYAGAILSDDGTPGWHVILLPGDAEGTNWHDAKNWAHKLGGQLPTRREQSLLFANLKDEFEDRWYWSGESHETDDAYAWYQYFYDGNQDDFRKDFSTCRARAVRRLIIE
jgi:hypothetical protein